MNTAEMFSLICWLTVLSSASERCEQNDSQQLFFDKRNFGVRIYGKMTRRNTKTSGRKECRGSRLRAGKKVRRWLVFQKKKKKRQLNSSGTRRTTEATSSSQWSGAGAALRYVDWVAELFFKWCAWKGDWRSKRSCVGFLLTKLNFARMCPCLKLRVRRVANGKHNFRKPRPSFHNESIALRACSVALAELTTWI